MDFFFLILVDIRNLVTIHTCSKFRIIGKESISLICDNFTIHINITLCSQFKEQSVRIYTTLFSYNFKNVICNRMCLWQFTIYFINKSLSKICFCKIHNIVKFEFFVRNSITIFINRQTKSTTYFL